MVSATIMLKRQLTFYPKYPCATTAISSRDIFVIIFNVTLPASFWQTLLIGQYFMLKSFKLLFLTAYHYYNMVHTNDYSLPFIYDKVNKLSDPVGLFACESDTIKNGPLII